MTDLDDDYGAPPPPPPAANYGMPPPDQQFTDLTGEQPYSGQPYAEQPYTEQPYAEQYGEQPPPSTDPYAGYAPPPVEQQYGEHPQELLPPPPPVSYEAPLPEPPSPMNHLATSTASLDRQSMASSIRSNIDINTEGLVEETMERLSRVRGVMGVLILDAHGLIVRTTMDERLAAAHAVPVQQLVQRALSVVALTPGDRLGMLCVRTNKHEMLICNEKHGAFTILVIQDPNADIDVATMVGAGA